MALGAVLRQYPNELRADFQRFYGLNLSDMGKTYSFMHAAVLAEQLPVESNLSHAIAPETLWSETDYLLHQIEFDLRTLIWAECGGQRQNKPKPLSTPADSARIKRMKAVDPVKIADALGIPESRR